MYLPRIIMYLNTNECYNRVSLKKQRNGMEQYVYRMFE